MEDIFGNSNTPFRLEYHSYPEILPEYVLKGDVILKDIPIKTLRDSSMYDLSISSLYNDNSDIQEFYINNFQKKYIKNIDYYNINIYNNFNKNILMIMILVIMLIVFFVYFF